MHRLNSFTHFTNKEHGNLIVTAGSSPDDNYIKIWNAEKGYMVSLDLIEFNVIKNGFASFSNFNN